MFRIAALVLLLLPAAMANAQQFTVTDIAGREITLDRPVERLVISEGRYIPLLALLQPEDPAARVVGMMTPLGYTQPALEQQLFAKFPAARDIPLFGARNKDSVSVEKIIDLQPEIAVFGINDHGPNARNAELLDQLKAAGIQVAFIDFRMDPMNNTVPSVKILGQILGREEKAADYIAFYRKKLGTVRDRVAGIKQRPSVFLQVHPGRFDCCRGMADGMMGPFIGLAGGVNIADKVAPGPTALHTEEFLLTANPDVWIGTASGTYTEFMAEKPPVALGAGMTDQTASESLKRYLDQPAFQALDAVKNGRAHAVWHNFYNSPFNIVALEGFAKWIHPDLFQDIDPNGSLQEIYDRYLPFELEGVYSATAAQ